MKIPTLLTLPMCFFISFIESNTHVKVIDGMYEGLELQTSYPRSGSHWAYGILQVLTGKPVKSLQNVSFKNFKFFNFFDVELNHEKPILYRTHYPYALNIKFNYKKNKLFTLLRNYKECIPRHENINANELYNIVYQEKESFKMYINNLIFYENWDDENTKLLIFYEDLISKPKQTIKKMLAFFEEDPENLDEFFLNFDTYREYSLNAYKAKNEHRKIFNSGGNKEIFHSKDFPPDILIKIDDLIKNSYPFLWEKYLKRYETMVES